MGEGSRQWNRTRMEQLLVIGSMDCWKDYEEPIRAGGEVGEESRMD